MTEIIGIPMPYNIPMLKKEAVPWVSNFVSLEDMNVRKAISVMRKDKILEQYQYFVGGKPELDVDDDIDGEVF